MNLAAAEGVFWQQLERLLDQDKLPSALMCWGLETPDRNAIVQRLVSQWLCLSHPPPCGHCISCQKFTAGVHPDLHELGKEGTITVDSVRQVLASLDCGATLPGRQLVVVWGAQEMNMSSVNALLKMVEEPPPRVHFIFVADVMHGLPLTLISRCYRLRIPSPPTDQGLVLGMETTQHLVADLLALAAGEKAIADLLPSWSKHNELSLLTFLWIWHVEAMKLSCGVECVHINQNMSLATLESYVGLLGKTSVLTIIDSLVRQLRAVSSRVHLSGAKLWLSDVMLLISHG